MARKKDDLSEVKPGSALEYLRSASPTMLQAFELSRLNHVANMRKDLQALVDRMVSDMSEALLARTLIDHRKELITKRSKLTPDELLQITGRATKLLTVGKK
jgi:hypothetical protein